MIVALLNRKRGVGTTTIAPHFAGQACRQGKRIALIDANPQGAELDWSRQHARRHRDRLLSVIGLVRHTPDRAVAGLAGHSDRIISILRRPRTCRTQGFSVWRHCCRHAVHLPAREFPNTNGERS